VGMNETWGKVKQSFYFLVKHVLKYVSLKNKTNVSLCPMFHSSPLPPTVDLSSGWLKTLLKLVN
jgi:hypothetical protein